MPSDPVETKLSAARTRLILDKPFIGTLVLRLPMVEADSWCKTTATDARAFYYNREFINELSLEQTQFMLAHEALHCALLHFLRRQHREKHRWDIACDFAINPLLIDDGLRPPPNILYMKEYTGMTAEEIYPLVDDSLDQEPLDQHLYDESGEDESDSGGQGEQSPNRNERDFQQQQPDRQQGDEKPSGKKPTAGESPDEDPSGQDQQGKAPPPEPLTENEREQLAVQWQQRLAGAAQTAMQAGKLGGGMARMVDHLLQPQLPWRMLLARYMTAIARDDYSFSRPSSRRDEGGAIFPSLRSTEIDLVAVVDTSGSIADAEVSAFVSEINAIKGQMRARITIHACDAQLAEEGPWEFEAWEEITIPESLRGGGATDFCPVFDWVSSRERQPDLLVYFTDAEGTFPAQEPPFPVIWLVKGKQPVPWGQRIQLNA